MTVQQQREQKHQKTLKLVETAMLAAIVVLMSFTPIGYLKVGALSITFIMIPVVIGGITVGPAAGAVLGAIWGATSFWQCFGMDAFGTTLMSLNPVGTFITCVVARILAGWLAGLIYMAISKIGPKARIIGCPIASLSVALLNTTLFMGSLVAFFWNTEYIGGFKELLGKTNVFGFILAFVGVNGAIEAGVTCVVGGAIAVALVNTLFKKRIGE